jgi:hypothetical protein
LTDTLDDQEVKNLEVGGLTAGSPPAYELEPFNKLVGFSNLAKTQHWHTCFASVLTEARLYEEAMGHFNQALEIDKDSMEGPTRQVEMPGTAREV